MLFKAAMDSFASTRLYSTAENTELWVSAVPPLGNVLGEEAHGGGPDVPRMSLRA